MKFLHALTAAAALAAALPAVAADITVDFEGVASYSPVGDFYAPFGISFSASALGLANDPDFPNFSNAPTPATILFAPDQAATMNFAQGFSGVVSVFYSSAVAGDSIAVFSGLSGSGSKLVSFDLTANAQLGCTDTAFCHWDQASLAFAGVGKSIVFGSNGGFVGYDNVTIAPVPEPSSLILSGAGLLGLMVSRRRKLAR
jgi:hypothetical protein